MHVLFLSPYCLLDPSSGASISCRSILEGLAARNHEARAVSATIFDKPRFASSEEFVKRIGARPISAFSKQRINVWGCQRQGVKYLIYPSRAQRRPFFTCAEAVTYQRLVMEAVKRQRPDVVLAYGGKPIDRDIYRWLREQGIPIVFYLANPNYGDKRTFQDVDLIVTDTKATSDLYKKRLGVDVLPIGKVITAFPPDAQAPRDCVTFVNPAPEKGAAIVVGIMQEMARRGAKTKFLLVESRRKLAPTLPALGVTPAQLPNVEYLPIQHDMSRVWRRTRVLLHPSLWHESGPRVTLEACSAGIPVLATQSGGIAELLGDSGFMFPIPPEVAKEYAKPVRRETAKTWCDVLERLVHDDVFYAQASARALRRWNEWCAGDALGKIETAMRELAAKAVKPQTQKVARKVAVAKPVALQPAEF
jgi:glycosyltransferase involved in cell wall biosynthesis